MSQHFPCYSAVFPLLLREHNGKREILLHRRYHTGYMDGKWDIAGSGHVDEGETARQALARECGEELGIRVRPEDAEFAHVCHRLGKEGDRTYYDLYFFVHAYQGTPAIMEPHKCDGLAWFSLDALPEDMIDFRRLHLHQALNGELYDEWF